MAYKRSVTDFQANPFPNNFQMTEPKCLFSNWNWIWLLEYCFATRYRSAHTVRCQLLKIGLFCITPVISRKPTRDSVDYNILFRSRLCPHKHTWQAWPTLRFCTAQLSTTDQLLIQLAHASLESTEIPQRVTVTGANSGWASGAKPSKSFEFMINSRKVETGNTTSWLQDEEFRCGHSQEQL